MKCDELTPIDLECNMGKDVNGVEHRVPWKAYDIDEVNAAIAELKAEINRKDGVQQRWFERCMEARAENRRLKHALWLARAERAREAFLKWNLFPNFETVNKLLTIDEYDETPGATDGRVLRTCIEWIKVWNNVERKCLAMVEEYK